MTAKSDPRVAGELELWVVVGAISGFLAVALGAIGAHLLEGRLSSGMYQVYQTAARYQMAHSLALLLVAALGDRLQWQPVVKWSARLFTAGILLFSGSLYLLAVTGVVWLGAITPFGGLCFLGGWLLLFLAAIRNRRSS